MAQKYLIQSVLDRLFKQFETSVHVDVESQKYHSMQTLHTEVWQYMEESGFIQNAYNLCN